jgi:hypothetical protein
MDRIESRRLRIADGVIVRFVIASIVSEYDAEKLNEVPPLSE